MSDTRNAGLTPVDSAWNDQAIAWAQDYDAWLQRGLTCVTLTAHMTPAEWDRWKSGYDAQGSVLMGIARSLIGAQIGDQR